MGTTPVPESDPDSAKRPAGIGDDLLRLVDTLLDARQPESRRSRALEQLTAQKLHAALPVVQKLHYLAQLMVAEDFFVLFGREQFLEARAALGGIFLARDLKGNVYQSTIGCCGDFQPGKPRGEYFLLLHFMNTAILRNPDV